MTFSVLTLVFFALPLIAARPALAQIGNVQSDHVLHSFGAGTDGRNPQSGLLNVGGTLYGTTSGGGANEAGTVYTITPSGTYSILYNFGAGPNDGQVPYGGLTEVGSTLYGTTILGGTDGHGTVYKITTSGTETILHSFTGGSSDGSGPIASLTKVGSTLYGSTDIGGSDNYGIIFKITPSGKYSILHNFTGGSDGISPIGALIDVGGTLYGTTVEGGASGDGTVFKITTSGTETVLHSFTGGSDGAGPYAGLTKVGSTLYGTTVSGGSNNDGTIFTITTSGTEAVVYNFLGSPTDGQASKGALLDLGGDLYGTTGEGGASNNGMIFEVVNQDQEIALFSFAGSPVDGANPIGSFINVGGTFYGTTSDGGANGAGTVFSFTL